MKTTTTIPMSCPDLTAAEADAVRDVLESNHLSLGPRLPEFEAAFASRIGRSHAVAVSSGTAALHLAVLASGIGKGDLVITSPFSFIASANCLLYEGAIPVFVDVDPVTGNIDPARVDAAVSDLAGGREGRRWLPRSVRDSIRPDVAARAILPVHAFGQPADMTAIAETADRHGLIVIEDACEAIGSAHRGRETGTYGVASCFAFYPNKQMTTGEGGMLATDSDEVANICRSLRNQGRDVFDAWLSHSRLGYNYRLTDIACALGIVQLGRLDDMLARRAQVAAWYHDRLRDVARVTLPAVVPSTTRMSWFVYVVRLESRDERRAVMRTLADAGIPSRPYFTPIHLQPFYVETFGYRQGDFPITEMLGECSLALPFSSVMTEQQVDDVCRVLDSAVAGQTT